MRSIWILSALLAAGCPEPPDTRTCDDVTAELAGALADIQACDDDLACGQVLSGTSCGCTRDLVARDDADPSSFEALLTEAGQLECDVGMDSPCDCPATAGFRCDQGTCVHNYLHDYPYLPVCHADRGAPLSIDAATLDGDELVLTVSFSGGCEEHDVVLCWPDQAFLESDPVQVNLEVFHDAHDDACEAYLTEARRLSLLPLQAAWRDGYGPGPGTIRIHVGGIELSYDFE